MRINLLRHGECLDQAWLRGRVNSELSPLGWQKMQHQLELIRPAQVLISSTAKRCALFSQQQYDQAWSEELVMEHAWQEKDFGVFDGLPFASVQQHYPQALAYYLDNPYEHDIPQSESFKVFQQRIDQAWSDLIQKNYESVLLVTHSGPMRLVLQKIMGFANANLFQFELDYAARITIEVIPTDTTPFCKLVEIVQAPRQL